MLTIIHVHYWYIGESMYIIEINKNKNTNAHMKRFSKNSDWMVI